MGIQTIPLTLIEIIAGTEVGVGFDHTGFYVLKNGQKYSYDGDIFSFSHIAEARANAVAWAAYESQTWEELGAVKNYADRHSIGKRQLLALAGAGA